MTSNFNERSILPPRRGKSCARLIASSEPSTKSTRSARGMLIAPEQGTPPLLSMKYPEESAWLSICLSAGMIHQKRRYASHARTSWRPSKSHSLASKSRFGT